MDTHTAMPCSVRPRSASVNAEEEVLELWLRGMRVKIPYPASPLAPGEKINQAPIRDNSSQMKVLLIWNIKKFSGVRMKRGARNAVAAPAESEPPSAARRTKRIISCTIKIRVRISRRSKMALVLFNLVSMK